SMPRWPIAGAAPSMSSLRSVGALALTLTWVAPLRAESAVPFRIEYQASVACPEEERFTAALLARTAHVRAALPAEPAIVLNVELAGDREHLIGRLPMLEPDKGETVRVVPGSSCEEVIDALAVIAAVLIVPEGASERPREPPAHSEPAAPVIVERPPP